MKKEKKEETKEAMDKNQRAQAVLEKLSKMRESLNQTEIGYEKPGAPDENAGMPAEDTRPKVFCRDCKFLRRHLISGGWQGICTAVQQEHDCWHGRVKEYPIQPGLQNKDNHCTMFKKKPFWRRGIKKIG